MSADTFNNKKIASEAGKKSRRGKSKKTLLWEQLGNFITEEGAKEYLLYLKELRKTDKKKFAEEYRAILEYFKPKQQRTELKGEIDNKTTSFDNLTFEQLYELKYGRKPD